MMMEPTGMLLSAAALGTVYASFSMLWGGGEEEIAPGGVNEDSDKSDTRLSAREETAFDRVARDVAKLNNLQLADITSSATFNEDGSLHHWDLRKKKIRKLPESFGEIDHLSGDLGLSSNQLRELPDSLCQVRIGGNLNMSVNMIQKLPENIGDLRVGAILNLSGNEIRKLPKSFGNIKVGKEIRLRRNPVAEKKPEFPGVEIDY